jgi:hypothetical protein
MRESDGDRQTRCNRHFIEAVGDGGVPAQPARIVGVDGVFLAPGQ